MSVFPTMVTSLTPKNQSGFGAYLVTLSPTPTPLVALLLQTKAKLPFDRAVDRAVEAFFHVLLTLEFVPLFSPNLNREFYFLVNRWTLPWEPHRMNPSYRFFKELPERGLSREVLIISHFVRHCKKLEKTLCRFVWNKG